MPNTIEEIRLQIKSYDLKKNDSERRIEFLFHRQNGICPWCGYMMLLEGPKEKRIRKLSATVDHLEEKSPNYIRTEIIAAHKVCNSERGHKPKIETSTLRKVQLALLGEKQKMRHLEKLKKLEGLLNK